MKYSMTLFFNLSVFFSQYLLFALKKYKSASRNRFSLSYSMYIY